MTHPGPEQPPQQRPAEPTRAVQLPKMPPPPPGGGGQQPPPPPRAPEQAPPPPAEQERPQEWAAPAEQQQPAPGWAPPGQPGPQQGWAPPGQQQGWAPQQGGPQQAGQQGWGQPGGQPPNQPQGAPYQGWNPPQGPGAGGKKGPGKALWITLAAVVVLVAAGLGAFFLLGSGEPSVGDCITPTADSFDVVDCDSADAQYKVLGKDPQEQTYEETAANLDGLCVDFPETTYVAWYGAEGEKGTVYCAGPA